MEDVGANYWRLATTIDVIGIHFDSKFKPRCLRPCWVLGYLAGAMFQMCSENIKQQYFFF